MEFWNPLQPFQTDNPMISEAVIPKRLEKKEVCKQPTHLASSIQLQHRSQILSRDARWVIRNRFGRPFSHKLATAATTFRSKVQ